MSETPKPQPELITGVPTPDELAIIENQRSHLEDTLTPGALKVVMAGATESAVDLNRAHPAPAPETTSLLSEQPTVLPEPYVPSEMDRVIPRAELRAITEKLRQEGKI